jgi:hypothetical protein
MGSGVKRFAGLRVQAIAWWSRVSRRDVELGREVVTVPAGALLALLG